MLVLYIMVIACVCRSKCRWDWI